MFYPSHCKQKVFVSLIDSFLTMQWKRKIFFPFDTARHTALLQFFLERDEKKNPLALKKMSDNKQPCAYVDPSHYEIARMCCEAGIPFVGVYGISELMPTPPTKCGEITTSLASSRSSSSSSASRSTAVMSMTSPSSISSASSTTTMKLSSSISSPSSTTVPQDKKKIGKSGVEEKVERPIIVVDRNDYAGMEQYVRECYANVIDGMTRENAIMFVTNTVNELFANYDEESGAVPKHVSSWSVYVEACRSRSQEILLARLKAGTWKARETCGTATRYEALHMAARYGCERVVQFLIETANVPIDTPSAFGRTALHYAFKGMLDTDRETDTATVTYLTRLLQKRTTNKSEYLRLLDVPDNAGTTPLEAALTQTPSKYWSRLPEESRRKVAWLLQHVPAELTSSKRALAECPEMATYFLNYVKSSAPPLSSSTSSSSSTLSSSSPPSSLTSLSSPAISISASHPHPQQEEDDGVCCICMAEMADTIVKPCGHCVVCRKCSVGLRVTSNAHLCVRCRMPISSIDE
jgi:hypothetical protein